MSILSNYTPECIVRASVECPVEQLSDPSVALGGEQFAKKLKQLWILREWIVTEQQLITRASSMVLTLSFCQW